MSKKSKKTTKTTTQRPGRRRKIVSLAQYEGERQTQESPTTDPQTPAQSAQPSADTLDTHAQASADEKKKRSSGLDAAVQVLREAGKPLTTGEMVKQMLDKGLWSTGGKTPAATIYSAIVREITVKGDASRFRKTERGHFELTDAAK